jgi:hypothetical protein
MLSNFRHVSHRLGPGGRTDSAGAGARSAGPCLLGVGCRLPAARAGRPRLVHLVSRVGDQLPGGRGAEVARHHLGSQPLRVAASSGRPAGAVAVDWPSRMSRRQPRRSSPCPPCGRPDEHRRPCRALARGLPETVLHATSRRPTPRPSTAPFTCAVVWSREVLHGGANRPRIDGKDGVAGSIPAGRSTPEPLVRPVLYPASCMVCRTRGPAD